MMVVIAMANDTATGMAIITGIATEIVTTTDKAIATRSNKVSRTGISKGRNKILPRSRRRLSAQASWKSFQTPTAACANSRMV
jgi:amino acid transporter